MFLDFISSFLGSFDSPNITRDENNLDSNYGGIVFLSISKSMAGH